MAIHRTRARTGQLSEASVRSARNLTGKVLSGFMVATLALGIVAAPAAIAAPAGTGPQRAILAAPAGPLTPAGPAEPTKSADAKKAWLAAADQADAMNELVLESQVKEKAAAAAASRAATTLSGKQSAATAAQAALDTANASAAFAQDRLRKAAATNAAYQVKVDNFTNASFRGAHIGSLSAMLMSNSPEDFLDTAATLNAVADDTHQTLNDAAAAKSAAKTAQTVADGAAASARTAAVSADTAVAGAADAKKQADSSKISAHAATVNVSKKQHRLKAEAAKMNKLYNSLTEKERQEALAAQERANELAAARAQAAADQAAADRSRREAAANAANNANNGPAAGNTTGNNAAGNTTANNAAGNNANNGPAAGNTTDNNAAGNTTTDNAASSSQSVAANQASPPSASVKASGKAAIAVQAAMSKEGAPYVFGASGPNEFDCSGLTSWAWAQAGVSIPRTSADQANLPYVPLDQLQPGDLITYYSPVHHVAMYIGNGQIINASTSSKPVSVMSMYYNGQNPTGHRVSG